MAEEVVEEKKNPAKTMHLREETVVASPPESVIEKFENPLPPFHYSCLDVPPPDHSFWCCLAFSNSVLLVIGTTVIENSVDLDFSLDRRRC